MEDYVVLVNEKNEPLSTLLKLSAHHKNTPLHQGFSLFLFNKSGELLLQQRSSSKKTWPGIWSNSVCGHPRLKETAIKAAKRRLDFELGIKKAAINMILPDYRYRFEQDGIVENEICPVMAGYSEETPKPNPAEVRALKWISWKAWLMETNKSPQNYSPWCVEETRILSRNKQFMAFLEKIEK